MTIYKKKRSFKKKRPILRHRFFWPVFLGLIFLSLVTYFFLFSGIFDLKQIDISGNSKIKTQKIEIVLRQNFSKNILDFSINNIFLADLPGLEKKILDSFPEADQVFLQRKAPASLICQIKEKIPVAIFDASGTYFYLDSKGIAFEKPAESSADFIKLKINDFTGIPSLGEKLIEGETLAEILRIDNGMKNILKIIPTEAVLVSPERLDVFTIEQWYVFFNPEKDVDWQITKIQAVLEKYVKPEERPQLEYVDVRFGDLAPYKYKEAIRE